jgi:hypothetical protein
MSTTAIRSLDSILAARKAQVTQARTQHLISLPRNGDDYDSDDDEEVDGDQHTGGTAHRPAQAALDLGRAANQIASRETDVRKRTLAALAEAELNADQLKPLLRPLLLRFADEAEKCRDLAVALFSRWQRAVDASEVAGALPFLVPVMVERLGSDTGTEPSEEVRAALVTLMRDVLHKCRALLRPYLRECGAIALGCCRDQHHRKHPASCFGNRNKEADEDGAQGEVEQNGGPIAQRAPAAERVSQTHSYLCGCCLRKT